AKGFSPVWFQADQSGIAPKAGVYKSKGKGFLLAFCDDLIGGAEGDRTPDLRIANGLKPIFMDQFFGLENRHFLPKTLTKTQPRTKKSTTKNYDLERPILINFGNVLATGKTWRSSGRASFRH